MSEIDHQLLETAANEARQHAPFTTPNSAPLRRQHDASALAVGKVNACLVLVNIYAFKCTLHNLETIIRKHLRLYVTIVR